MSSSVGRQEEQCVENYLTLVYSFIMAFIMVWPGVVARSKNPPPVRESEEQKVSMEGRVNT